MRRPHSSNYRGRIRAVPYTGFGTAWIDVENNGMLDLLAVNGAVTVEERLVQAGVRLAEILNEALCDPAPVR